MHVAESVCPVALVAIVISVTRTRCQNIDERFACAFLLASLGPRGFLSMTVDPIEILEQSYAPRANARVWLHEMMPLVMGSGKEGGQ